MKDEPKYWHVLINLNHEARTYTVDRVIHTTTMLTPLCPHYVQTQAQDEIGAFNEAQKVLARLGFKPGA